MDAQSHYMSVHGKFYADTNISKTFDGIGYDSKINSLHDLNVKVGETTILTRVNRKNRTDYVYMFSLRSSSNKIIGYNKDTWEGTACTKDCLGLYGSRTDIDLQNDGEIVSTYKNKIIKQKKSNFCFLNKD